MSLSPPTRVQKHRAAFRARSALRPLACFLVREPCAGNPQARFDERGVETEHGEAIEAPADERAGNR